MALNDTYVRLELNYAHSSLSGLSLQAQRSAVFGAGKGGAAFVNHSRSLRSAQKRIGGKDGLVGDSKSVYVGRNGVMLPLSELWRMHQRTVQDLADGIAKGIITAKVFNKGRTMSTIVGIDNTDNNSWASDDGWTLTADEMERMYIEPRKLYQDIVADPAAVAADIDKFLYIPRYGSSKMVFEVGIAGGAGPLVLDVYSWNPVTNIVTLVHSEPGLTASQRIEVDDLPPYIHPVITGIVGETVQINVGVSSVRV